MERQKRQFGSRISLSRIPMIVLAGTAAVAAAPAMAVLPSCTSAVLSSLGVPGVTVSSVADVAAAAPNPEYCHVTGTLTTTGDGAPNGSARFEMQLPAGWNQKFLFWGVGGTAGSTFADLAANPVDTTLALAKGYAIAITDTGHQAGATDSSWALESPGVPDRAKLTDYYFRATHQVTVAAKAIARGYYKATAIKFSYFDGCSNGGRQAMVEATHFPEDYDGIIAGAPFMDIRTIMQGAKAEKNQLRSPDSYIPFSSLPAIDAAVYASCDAVDGVKDGLIQNPAKCAFDPKSLVCASSTSTGCLTANQAETLTEYTSALRDEDGRLLYPGAAISDLAGGYDVWTGGFFTPDHPSANEPFADLAYVPLTWQFSDGILKYIVERDPTFDLHTFPVSEQGVVTNGALALFDARTEAGDGDRPERLGPFIRQNRKLLLFHGFSDPALPPFRTIKYYEDLAAESGSYRELQENVRLFLVPGMQHCLGGPGPNFFDTLSSLESWVETGVAPDGIPAEHFVNNDPTKALDRTMPLCKFPEQAAYKGSGDVNSIANWSCTANRRLLEVGPDGARAGLSSPGSDDDGHGHGDD